MCVRETRGGGHEEVNRASVPLTPSPLYPDLSRNSIKIWRTQWRWWEVILAVAAQVMSPDKVIREKGPELTQERGHIPALKRCPESLWFCHCLIT